MTAFRIPLLVLCCVLLVGCTSPVPAPSVTAVPGPAKPAAALTHIVVSTSVTANNLPEWLAKESGIFAKHGLDVEFQTLTDANSVAAIISGAVQFTPTGASQAVLANRAVVQQYVDAIVESIALVKRDKPATDHVIKKYLFADMIESMAETNQKVRGFDITKLTDTSFVESAASRGLDN